MAAAMQPEMPAAGLRPAALRDDGALLRSMTGWVAPPLMQTGDYAQNRVNECNRDVSTIIPSSQLCDDSHRLTWRMICACPLAVILFKDQEVQMRRFLLAPAVIIVASIFLAQVPALSPDKTEEHPAPSCVVAGHVVTAAESSPLKSARVALVQEHSGASDQIYATTSDGDGRFLLKDVAPGRYQFFATRVGFVGQQYQSKGNDGGAVLTLKPGQVVSDVFFRMTVAAVVTGRVTNEDGEAMVGAQVVALRRPSEEEIEDEVRFAFRKRELQTVASAQADDRGQYRIFGLKAGEYYLRVTDSFEPDGNVPGEGYRVRQFLGSEYASVYYPGVPQVGQAQMVLVRAGEEIQADVSVQRVKTVEVAGHVIGPNGPAKDTWVRLEQSGVDDSGIDRQDTTDEKGNFRVKGVPPGSYVIVAYASIGENTVEVGAQEKVEVGGENINSLTLSLGGGTSFQGRVAVAGPGSVTLDHIFVVLSPIHESERIGRSSRVKKDGTFEITSVMDGDYTIHVWGLADGWYVKSVRLGSDDILEKGLQLERGGSGGRFEVIVSSASAQLEGSVSEDDGAVIGARVRVVPDPETAYNRFRSQSTRTDQTGHFSLAGLAPGTYRVFARFPISSENSSRKSEPQIFTLSEHDHKTVQLKILKVQAE
jgi:hypothetical protein